MRVETKWFGTIEIGEDKIITFEKGLIGFEDSRRFTIVYNSENENETSIMWLQSVDNVSLALPIMKPEIVIDNYDPVVEDELIYALGDNIDTLKGVQVIADNEDYQVRYPIYDVLESEKDGE